MRADVYVAASLDGFIARSDGSLDWLMDADSGDGEYGFEEFLASVDALVMGRKTFDFVLEVGEWPYGDKPVFVLTHRRLELPGGLPGRVEPVSGEPHEVASVLDRRDIERAYVDGGEVIRSFLRAGLVQRLIITTLPVLLGTGIPLFGVVDGDVRLRFVRHEAFDNGWTQVEYEVV